jgi:uncharacterized protein YgiM (DUF1202 family)
MKAKKYILILAILGLTLAACGPNAESAIGTALAQTQQISQLQTAAAGPADTNTPEPSATQDPASLVTDTPASTATSSIAMVSVTVDTFCRSGPRIDYKALTTILVGEQVQVLATYPSGDYVIVQRINGAGSCWLWLRYATQTDFSGYNLPIATMPPTSTFTFTPSPTHTPSYTPTPTP